MSRTMEGTSEGTSSLSDAVHTAVPTVVPHAHRRTRNIGNFDDVPLTMFLTLFNVDVTS